METAPLLNNLILPTGSQVGPWRVVDRQGHGTYGTVYRAVRIGHESEAPVALKLAVFSEDPRFAREVELLSRLQHPCVPRLEDSGRWRHPCGATYPYLAMEWVEGTALYDWAQKHRPSSRQVLGLLAQLARALEATHAAGGVHRDVKGGNVLVREDGQPFLTDFGAGRYQGAETLTWQVLPPGTPAYRSPEAFQFVLGAGLNSHYAATPADDVFALGVTAWRLVTGDYPPSANPRDGEAEVWSPGGTGPRPPSALNPRCAPELSALILRMLRLSPEARGSARELAEALEDSARRAGPEADTSLWAPEPAAPALAPHLTHGPPWRAWAVAASLGFALVLLASSQRTGHTDHSASEWLTLPPLEQNDGGTVGVADAAVEKPERNFHEVPVPPREDIGLQMPPKPFPGQVTPRPDGRCRRKGQHAINGGCWGKWDVDMETCKEEGYEYKGGCYLPMYPPVRSSPVSGSAPAGGTP